MEAYKSIRRQEGLVGETDVEKQMDEVLKSFDGRDGKIQSRLTDQSEIPADFLDAKVSDAINQSNSYSGINSYNDTGNIGWGVDRKLERHMHCKIINFGQLPTLSMSTAGGISCGTGITNINSPPKTKNSNKNRNYIVF